MNIFKVCLLSFENMNITVLSENIFNRHVILLDKEIIYKNFYLINLEENDTNIFSFSNLHDALNTKKIHKNKILWNELLITITFQKIKKLLFDQTIGRISDKEYKNIFFKIEYKSTWRNLIYVIIYLPILSGIALFMFELIIVLVLEFILAVCFWILFLS